ncbi:MAG TPA: ABC transporter ATP-binding protein [Clostridiaceae bacterium]|jgi:branched-chain amino acid transport system ATP-binding protein|nr:ABC transporter ATP-binding protein [Clostridiaceae bacterium]HHX19360.1 ABC transporter ATP-binding protein [Clostridiaceae bacterium]
MLRVEDINTFYGTVQALHEVSINVNEGELVSLIGANGAGKSTTLRTISGLRPPAKGLITFRGERIDGLRAYEIVKKGIVMCPEGRHVFPQLTVYENLLMGAFTENNKQVIKQSLERVYAMFPILQKREKQAAGTFSGGEQQMLAIARALMARPQLLMLDEPSLGLAPIIIQDIVRIILELKKEKMTILLVEQNAKLALKLSDRAYCLENGKVSLSGSAEELATNPRIKELYLGG